MSKENKPQKIGTDLKHVIDDESGQVIEITDDMRSLAGVVSQQLQGQYIITGILLQLVRDRKLYLVYGCGSFQEYAETNLPFGRRVAYQYITIGEKITSLLNINLQSVQTSAQISEKLASDTSIKRLSEINFSTMYEFAKLEEADFEEVASKGIIKTGDKEWDIEEIVESSVRKVRNELLERSKEQARRISNLQEDKKTAESERDGYKSKLERSQKDIERADELNKMFGKKGVELKNMYDAIDKTNACMRKVQTSFGVIDTLKMDQDKVPDTLKEEIRGVLRVIHQIQQTAMMRFPFLAEDISELQPFPTWMVKDPKTLGKYPDGSEPEMEGALYDARNRQSNPAGVMLPELQGKLYDPELENGNGQGH